MCHVCFTIEHTLLYGAFCFAFMLLSTSVFTQSETDWKTPPPLPILQPHLRACPPPV